MTALGFNNPGKRINDGLVSSEDEEVSLFEVNQRNKEENNDAELLSSKSNGTVNVRESTRERTSKQRRSTKFMVKYFYQPRSHGVLYDDSLSNGMGWHGLAWDGMAWDGRGWHGMA
ncbi:predicted protein [Nematostella vectensis]|uniref:Uncharacterized protein n=1 Tax=Nematostella vectensis TaxID=45351 RepID=A7SZ49_NEMVE|nr:predicted protein [Nematostella vectensis]|eukprot:XP_001623114.1 predicted protein [Nematostella vectensis]